MAIGSTVNKGTIEQGVLSFSETLVKPWLFMHTTNKAYTIDGTNSNFSEITPVGITAFTSAAAGAQVQATSLNTLSTTSYTGGTISTAATLTLSSNLITYVAGAVTPSVGQFITSAGGTGTLPANTYVVGVNTTSIPYSITINQNATASGTGATLTGLTGASVTISGAIYAGTWPVTSATATSFNITTPYTAGGTGTWINALAAGFPPNQTPARLLVPGAVFLDSTTYVMTTDGRIYGSALENPNQWDALNYLTKTSEPDGGVAIAKHINWLLAWGKWSMEVFYDAGNPLPGSPLSRNESGKAEIGCTNGNSVVQFANTVMWVGQSRETGRGVFILEGLSPSRISTQAIERFLNASSLVNVRAYAMTIEGHTWYVLSLLDTGYTFVFDLNEKTWYQWTVIDQGIEERFDEDFYASLQGLGYVLDGTSGQLASFSTSAYQDYLNAIPFRIVTPLIDGNTNDRKFFSSLEIIGDRTNTQVLTSHTDDDYTTFSARRSVNMNTGRPIIRQLGASRRRAYEIYHTDNTPLRIAGLELTIVGGSE
jgi:hypothetical protein